MQLHYSDLIRVALYFKKISLSALSGNTSARCSVMTPPAILLVKLLPKRTEHYPAEISGTWYHFGRNRNRIRKKCRISGQAEPEPDIRYIPNTDRLQSLIATLRGGGLPKLRRYCRCWSDHFLLTCNVDVCELVVVDAEAER